MHKISKMGHHVEGLFHEIETSVKRGDLRSVVDAYMFRIPVGTPVDTWFTESSAPHRLLTMVHVASEQGQVQILEWLFSMRAHAELPQPTNGNTPLILAVNANKADAANILLDNHAVVSCKYNKNMSAIWLAVSKGYTKTVSILLRHHANVNDVYREKALITLALDGDGDTNKHMALILLRNKAYPNIKSVGSNKFPIHYAAQHGDCEVLQALIAAKAYPSYQDKDGMTPLHYAVRNEHTQASILLLESSSHAEVTSMVKACSKHFNRTPLHEACMFSTKHAMQNAVDIANVLIPHGAVVDYAAASKYTALHMAAMHGNLAMVVLLLESGANLFLKNLSGFTPREVAVESAADKRSHLSTDSLQNWYNQMQVVISLLLVTEKHVLRMVVQQKEPTKTQRHRTWFGWGKPDEETGDEIDQDMREMLEREKYATGISLLDTVDATDLAHFISTSVHDSVSIS